MPVFKVVTKYSGDHIKSHYENKYHDKDAVDDVISYVLRTDKTSPDLVGGFCVNPYMAADQFRIIARVHNKEYGGHLRHMVLSFSDTEPVGTETAKKIAYQIAAFYGDEYQILYAVHIDARHLNIHFVMNTVSFRTGMKYDGKKQDYYQFIAYMKQVLGWYELELYVAADYPT